MAARLVALLLALVALLLALVAVGACGRIGPPVRSAPAPPSASAPAEPERDSEEKSP